MNIYYFTTKGLACVRFYFNWHDMTRQEREAFLARVELDLCKESTP